MPVRPIYFSLTVSCQSVAPTGHFTTNTICHHVSWGSSGSTTATFRCLNLYLLSGCSTTLSQEAVIMNYEPLKRSRYYLAIVLRGNVVCIFTTIMFAPKWPCPENSFIRFAKRFKISGLTSGLRETEISDFFMWFVLFYSFAWSLTNEFPKIDLSSIICLKPRSRTCIYFMAETPLVWMTI